MNDLTTQLANIRIVMIGTTLPANIGSAARAMHTMGLTDLVVINPRLPIDDSSIANAAGGKTVLDNAIISDDLHHSLADCTLILAASARTRQMPKPIMTPQLASQLIARHQQAHGKHGKIAILFGREDRGLTNEELALADYHIQIPANPDYPVLNVANAIQVIAASIYATLTHHDDYTPLAKEMQGVTAQQYPLDIHIRGVWDEPAITHAQRHSLDDAIIDLMKQLNLAQDDNLRLLPQRLSRLSQRLQLDQKEYALLRSLLAKIKQNLKT